MADVEVIRRALGHPLAETHFEQLGERYRGKVRDNYTTEDGRRYLITTDRISAFDRVVGTLPLKGQVLQHTSQFWFDATGDIAPNHVLTVPDPNVVEARACQPLAVEMVVRAYITGVTSTSIWTHYQQGKRVFCGHQLPDGLRKNERLEEPLLTPSSKAPQGGHDVSMSRQELLDAGAITAADFDAAAEIAMALFRFGQRHCEQRGLILVDTKYEFGKDADGVLRVIDEVHTPDSSRFWRAASYEERLAAGREPESFDKEYVRRWLAEAGFRGDGPIPEIPDEVRTEAARRYIEACETITGAPFEPDLTDPLPRMHRNLKLDGEP
ncbi:MAG: phosphoribosylaminoimidazolesuccinocarboxamide synthase [Deltaproteobacteria bacterium]|jgi:phosphoribosylaminoimidazole-succinocarboxamide synthase|nr:phosphoribosylaminoimidazolesuccinocarboxamide synthase [Deltaproteobacteria bacterium]MBW2530404.1 phosphoribosylaminoimidazolesuccinocarboxamide synthase [Deltaproteobacteria bacterium]